ncbi:aminotransferase class I/II-fold pyridoxal phosphate-dependent enzyme [Deinococcus alpinitundrae]|uniref:aminotransferase class I/II-fold pyridoxal phosphate-dependent enzyme n=1 Tax=Deinococcus alpinitundrae TaxID=468913 RepID=UPI00137A2CB3|nr:aminotransferase class I/II-fold pyridoxal phosphate-dependent enzyme [Deinococcus alpinitundrae]
MALDRFHQLAQQELDALSAQGKRKSLEAVVEQVIQPQGDSGPRFVLRGDATPYLRMNANSYLGLTFHPELIEADEQAVRAYGVGPGAVRFISGSYLPHVELEARLAQFHGREAAMIFSSAYATVLSVLSSLITPQTAVISDELNHNCIINAVKLSRPHSKAVYKHLDLNELDARLSEAKGAARALVVTDGIFSMRGAHAPLAEIAEICRAHDANFPEAVLLVVDDSHGVGAFGQTGRGTEEFADMQADVLIGTLGKAFGVNGGYVTGSRILTEYLREKSPTYIYSNPITAGEAAAAKVAVDLTDSAWGRERLSKLRTLTEQFRSGLKERGFETLDGQHPVVPLFVRDQDRLVARVADLKAKGILATGISYPVVPRGDESVRFQINADHTPADVDEVLAALG